MNRQQILSRLAKFHHVLYSNGPWSDFGYPLKLHEYLAAGLPVVSTALPAIRGHRDFFEIADDENELARGNCAGAEWARRQYARSAASRGPPQHLGRACCEDQRHTRRGHKRDTFNPSSQVCNYRK